MNDKTKEKYTRWESYRIQQLSFSINLFLSFAVASMAFAINLKLDNKISDIATIDYVIKLWALSAGLGCLATISRLLDYRYTAKKVRNPNKFNTFMSSWCGPFTWGTFWGQLIIYITAAYFFGTSTISP